MLLKKYKELFGLNEDPEYLAKGFALGTFIGMLPIPGFQIFVSLLFASLLKVHKVAAATAVFNTNVFTGVFIYSFNYWLGKSILHYDINFNMPSSLSFDFVFQILNSGKEVFFSLLLGGVIVGIVSSFLAYHIIILVSKRKNLSHEIG